MEDMDMEISILQVNILEILRPGLEPEKTQHIPNPIGFCFLYQKNLIY